MVKCERETVGAYLAGVVSEAVVPDKVKIIHELLLRLVML